MCSIVHSLSNVPCEAVLCKILLGFNCRKQFVSANENSFFIWSENRSDVIQHISLLVLTSWIKLRKNNTNFAIYPAKIYSQGRTL